MADATHMGRGPFNVGKVPLKVLDEKKSESQKGTKQ